MFILSPEISPQDRAILATLKVVGDLPEFTENTASNADNIPTDNPDIFGFIQKS